MALVAHRAGRYLRYSAGDVARVAFRHGPRVYNTAKRMYDAYRNYTSGLSARRSRPFTRRVGLKARRGHVLPLRRARRVATGSRPSVGVIDHKTRRMKFSVYQHYGISGATGAGSTRDIAITMSASELLFVFQPGATPTDAGTWRARQPAFYNVAAKWMSFNVTGMKMEISDETPVQMFLTSSSGGPTTVLYDHRGGAWSTVWNETEADSHKPMVQYVENVHPPSTVPPRWSFQKEAKWEDKSYRRAKFRPLLGQSLRSMKMHKRPFFKRYSALRSTMNAGEGQNGIHVEPTRRDVLPVLHLHQPDQFLQYQANSLFFYDEIAPTARILRFRVKKTFYIEFVDKREMRDISRTPMSFRPHNDECWNIEQRASTDVICGGCTASVEPGQCQIAGAPSVGPVQDPAACKVTCGSSCESMICPPGEVASSWTAEGCVDACLPGLVTAGAPCFEAPPCPPELDCGQTIGAACAAAPLEPGDNCYGSTPADNQWKLTRSIATIPDPVGAYPCGVGEVLKPDSAFAAGCETDIIRASCQPI